MKLSSGFVKLLFTGQAYRFDELLKKCRHHLPENAVFSLASKFVSISLAVPKIDPIYDSIATQQEAVEVALRWLSALEQVVLDGMQNSNSV